MALNRAWYNALVDDDGSNTVGTVWGKDDIKNLLDSVDVEIARLDSGISNHQYASVYMANASGQSIPHNQWTALSFDAAQYNAFGLWTGSNPTAVSIPVTGVYLITAQAFFNVNATGIRGLKVFRNGSVPALPDVIVLGNGGMYGACLVTGATNFNAGDYIQIQGFQSSGAALQSGGYGYPSTNLLRVDKLY